MVIWIEDWANIRLQERILVSVKNQFDLRYVPFEELVDPENLVTMVRYIKTDSDFHQLARYLEQEID